AVADRVGSGLLVLPVAAEHHRALDQDLAVLGDPDGHAGHRAADRTDLLVLLVVRGDGGGGLGEAVALEHRNADAAEEVAEAGAERGATGDRALTLAAEGGTELAV